MTGGTALQRLDLGLRSVTPLALTLLLALVPVLPLAILGGQPMVPSFTLMSVFYWTVYRPDLLPAAAVFAVGLVQDLVSGAPIGLTPMILLGTYGIVLGQRFVFLGKPFAVAWWGFMMVALTAALVSWLMTCLINLKVVGIGQPMMQFAVTWALFPLLVWFFIRTHRRVLRRV